MEFPQAIESTFKNYVNFTGRACRSEFWYFQLFLILGGLAANILDMMGGGGILTMLWNFAVLIPSISVTVRRFHDIGRTGWWIFLPFTIIGIIPYIWMLCIKGDEQHNQFGSNPLIHG